MVCWNKSKMAASHVRHSYHRDCEAGINKQINLELYASYVYLAMNQTLGDCKQKSDEAQSEGKSESEATSENDTATVTMVTLPDGSTAVVQQNPLNSRPQPTIQKFVDGQPVQLEDGTTAYIHSSHKEGLQVVQLEDGTTAYISSPLNLECTNSNDPSSVTNSEESTEVDKMILTRALSESVRASSRAIALGDRAFRCSVDGCGRLYTTQHHLKVHERSHTGDRPFRCEAPGCHKAFATGYGLKSHTRVHTGEKPYRCVEECCDKAFKTSGDLQKHVRTHTGERPFKCPFDGCNRSFTTSNIRKVHVRTHTGERPYVCPEEGCGRAFASATNYKNHIRIHTGEKPYVCTVLGCNKRFTEYSSLYKHHVVHTHSKPYACTICGKHYRQTSTLAMHTRTAHGLLDSGDLHVCDEGVLLENESAEKTAESAKKRQRIQLMVAGTDVNDSMAVVALQAARQATEQAISQVNQEQAQIAMERSTPQILVVADAAQFAALQQLSQQHLPIAANEAVVSGDVALSPSKEGCSVITYSVAPI